MVGFPLEIWLYGGFLLEIWLCGRLVSMTLTYTPYLFLRDCFVRRIGSYRGQVFAICVWGHSTIFGIPLNCVICSLKYI
jgi:hypothetical protein